MVSLRYFGIFGYVFQIPHLCLQGIHLWSFDGLPDHYGQWDVEDVAVTATTVAALESSQRPRLGSTGSSTGGILQPAPRVQQRSWWKFLIVFVVVGGMGGGKVRR